MDQVLTALLGTSECTLNRPWHDLTAAALLVSPAAEGHRLVGSPTALSCWSPLALLLGQSGWPWRKAHFFGLGCRERAPRSGSACLSMPAVSSVACSGTTAGKRSSSISSSLQGLGTGFLCIHLFPFRDLGILQKPWRFCFQGKIFKWMVSLNGRLVWGCVILFLLFLFCFAERFMNVVYQSLTVCFLKGSDLGGFSFSILLKSVLKDLKHKKQPSPTSHPNLPKLSPKTTKKVQKTKSMLFILDS